MKNNPYNRPGYTHAVPDANRDFYSCWANDNKKKVKAPKSEKNQENKGVATTAAAAIAPAKKKSGPVAKILLVLLLLACIASVVALNFLPTEIKDQILLTFKNLIGIHF